MTAAVTKGYLVKFVGDSALLFLLLGTQDGHDAALDDFPKYRDESYLDLNVNKTKETMVDFRRHTQGAIQIHDKTIEIVHSDRLYSWLKPWKTEQQGGTQRPVLPSMPRTGQQTLETAQGELSDCTSPPEKVDIDTLFEELFLVANYFY